MDVFKCIEEISIPSACGYAYDGVAFDGCYYYFLLPCARKIIKTNQCFSCVDCFEVCKEYGCICYDYKEHCFWAASRRCGNKIFKLNECFKEVDCITICGCEEVTGVITGISYNCYKDDLMVAFAGGVVSVSKKSEEAKVKYKSEKLLITGICSVAPYYIITAIKDRKQCLVILDSQNNPICRELMSWDFSFKTILFNPCVKGCNDCKKYQFDILANKKGCYSYMLQVKLNPCEIEFFPCACNECVCQKCCNETHCKPCHACTDVIESIALVETALSHILNAEGEKLQKVLATTDDLNEILCVNKEINKTIINATHLEHALYAKLSAALECGCYDDICDEGCGCNRCCDCIDCDSCNDCDDCNGCGNNLG